MVGSRVVIVADDDPDIRDGVAGLLRDEGLDVRVAQDGRAALDLLEVLGDERCVLLLDLMMPILSGFEVLRLLESAGRLPGLPVIVCSASARLGALGSGVRAVLRKPIDIEELLTLVSAACKASEMRQRTSSETDPVIRGMLSPSIVDAACAVLEGDDRLEGTGVARDARIHRLGRVRAVLYAWREDKLTTDGAEHALRAILWDSSSPLLAAPALRRGSGL